MFIISISLTLIGGGRAPLIFGVISSILATRIYKKLNWWNDHLSEKTENIFARLWPWSFIIAVGISLFSVKLAVFGWPFILFLDLDIFYILLYISGNVSTLFLVIAILSGIGYDLKNAEEEL
jgi:hypothetical protein